MPAAATKEDFEALLNESFELETPDEGSVVKGTVLAIEAGQAIIDIGYKMEGRVDLKEFAAPGKSPEIKIGDVVDSRRPTPRRSASRARSSAGSRAASPSTSAAPWPSCRAPRSTCVPCATPAR